MSIAELASAPSVRPDGRATPEPGSPRAPTYAALDLGTNNCRLLIARPHQRGFRVVDSFSRIVRLGEGLTGSGRLSEGAMARTLEALDVCRSKMDARGVTRARLIATEACRQAQNGRAFIERVREALGIDLEVVDRETEAHLAAGGCASLADPAAEGVLLFDIGGGSSEVVWLVSKESKAAAAGKRGRVAAWASLPLGVVTLSERFGGVDVSDSIYDAMVSFVAEALHPFVARVADQPRCRRFHLLGTSGTVTTVAGVHLNLPRYDRRYVDGLTMSVTEMNEAIDRLRAMTYDERAVHGCIGAGRADLVLAGCAILDAISDSFPSASLRVADRGLREGILIEMMKADGVWDVSSGSGP